MRCSNPLELLSKRQTQRSCADYNLGKQLPLSSFVRSDQQNPSCSQSVALLTLLGFGHSDLSQGTTDDPKDNYPNIISSRILISQIYIEICYLNLRPYSKRWQVCPQIEVSITKWKKHGWWSFSYTLDIPHPGRPRQTPRWYISTSTERRTAC